MSEAEDIAAELMEAYQDFSGSTPTISHDGEEVEIMPNAFGNDPMYVGGGTAESSETEVATLFADWDTPPEDLDVISLEGHASLPDGDYQVLRRRYHEAWLVFTLGNSDAK